MIDFLFDTSNWPPRWYCGQWTEALGYTHIISDTLTFAAYMAIPSLIAFFVFKRKDFPFHKLSILFALFILFCGVGHLVEAIIFYYPVYRFAGLIKACTAIVSCATAIAIIPILPKLLALPRLSAANEELKSNLQETKGRLAAAFDNIGSELFDWDVKNDVVIFSDELHEKLGYDTFNGLIDNIHPEEREKVRREINRLRDSGGRFHTQFRVLTKVGEYRWFEGTGQALVRPGESNRVVGTINEIHAQILAEQERNRMIDLLTKSNEMLNQKNKVLKEFSYLCAHDLKEPIRGISNYAEILTLELDKSVSDENKELLKNIKEQCAQANLFVDSLLDYSVLSYKDHYFEKVDLQTLLDDVLKTLSSYLDTNHAVVSIPIPLPTIYCDKVRMSEVFRNLIANAVKYNDNKSKKVEITFQEQDKSYQFWVKDNGIGIDKKHHDLVFKMFKRIQRDKKYGQGTGLGLAMVAGVVEKHQGKVWLESEPGRGTTFIFTISKSLNDCLVNKTQKEITHDSSDRPNGSSQSIFESTDNT